MWGKSLLRNMGLSGENEMIPTKKEIIESDELLADVFSQACWLEYKGKYCHSYISSYERAQAYLVNKGIIKEEECFYPTR